ncbi:MAG: protein-disulfide reductase DsbD family protein [Rhodobacteraceae bacterium]|nr:protein-disulfide reductase DsbD family protein [Paracoccaceae bacterium]
MSTISVMVRGLCAVLAVVATASGGTAQMLSSDPDALPARIELLQGWRETGESGARHIFGLRVSMDEGWKTYWRNPGQSGFPPHFEWTGLENSGQPTVHYPRPGLLTDQLSGIRILGYEKTVVLPIEVALDDVSESAVVQGVLQYGVCREICIPARYDIHARLPANATSPHAGIVSALADMPFRIHAADSAVTFTCSFTPLDGDSFSVAVAISGAINGQEEFVAVFDYPDPLVGFSDADAVIGPDGTLQAWSEMRFYGGRVPAVDRSRLQIAVVTPESTTEYSGCSSAG